MEPIPFHLYEDVELNRHDEFKHPENRLLLPRSLMFHPRGLPSVGIDIEVKYRRTLDPEQARRDTALGVVRYENRTGWIAQLNPRGLVEDDPYQNFLDLLKIYQVFGTHLADSNRRSEMLVIGRYIEVFWIRQERRLRESLLFTSAR